MAAGHRPPTSVRHMHVCKLHARAGYRALSLSLPPGGSQGPGWARGARSDRAVWQPGPPPPLVVPLLVERAPDAHQRDRNNCPHPSPRPSDHPADPPGRPRALLAHCIEEDGPTCFGEACSLAEVASQFSSSPVRSAVASRMRRGAARAPLSSRSATGTKRVEQARRRGPRVSTSAAPTNRRQKDRIDRIEQRPTR